MCGIAGYKNLDGRPIDQSLLTRMVAGVSHRGPDGQGFFLDEKAGVGLAHARLGIIDLQTGQQPIGNEDGTVVVVANGEIFNYIELRRDLAAQGHIFKTQSDIETIVHLYEEYGEDLVHQLNGQFAFALWDGRRRRLMLVRDRPGILPLFYCQTPSRLAFGSEIKSLLPALDSVPAMNPDALAEILTYWAPVSPGTAFKGIFEVEPGQMLCLDSAADAPVRKRKYWNWMLASSSECRSASDSTGKLRLAEELYGLLDDSVRIRLRADVPVGVYISGGLDSSVLAALVRKRQESVTAFCVGFEDKELDEGPYQDEVAKSLSIDASRVVCKAKDIRERFLQCVEACEVPITRAAPVPMFLLSERVSKSGCRVVLTGEGADEVLGGYGLFQEAKIRAFCARFPDSSMRSALFKRLYPDLNVTRGQSVRTLKSFFASGDSVESPYFSHFNRWKTGAWACGFLTARFRTAPSYTSVASVRPAELAQIPLLSRAQLLEVKTFMAPYLLSSQGDRMLMAHAVEGRFPYLDHRVIEFANALDPRLKMRGLISKYLLRTVGARLVPPAVLNRPKHAYRAPDAEAFCAVPRPDYVHELLSDRTIEEYGYFDSKRVAQLDRKIQAAVSGRTPVSHRESLLWMTVLSTQAWHFRFQIKKYGVS